MSRGSASIMATLGMDTADFDRGVDGARTRISGFNTKIANSGNQLQKTAMIGRGLGQVLSGNVAGGLNTLTNALGDATTAAGTLLVKLGAIAAAGAVGFGVGKAIDKMFGISDKVGKRFAATDEDKKRTPESEALSRKREQNTANEIEKIERRRMGTAKERVAVEEEVLATLEAEANRLDESAFADSTRETREAAKLAVARQRNVVLSANNDLMKEESEIILENAEISERAAKKEADRVEALNDKKKKAEEKAAEKRKKDTQTMLDAEVNNMDAIAEAKERFNEQFKEGGRQFKVKNQESLQSVGGTITRNPGLAGEMRKRDVENAIQQNMTELTTAIRDAAQVLADVKVGFQNEE